MSGQHEFVFLIASRRGLAAVLSAWPTLRESVKASILAMVKATKQR